MAGVAFKVVHIARHGGYSRMLTDFMSLVESTTFIRVDNIVNEGFTEST